jgi:hypothetical protein
MAPLNPLNPLKMAPFNPLPNPFYPLKPMFNG